MSIIVNYNRLTFVLVYDHLYFRHHYIDFYPRSTITRTLLFIILLLCMSFLYCFSCLRFANKVSQLGKLIIYFFWRRSPNHDHQRICSPIIHCSVRLFNSYVHESAVEVGYRYLSRVSSARVRHCCQPVVRKFTSNQSASCKCRA